MKLSSRLFLVPLLLTLPFAAGCGDASSQIPTAITAEDEAAMQAEEKRIAAEEMAHRRSGF